MTAAPDRVRAPFTAEQVQRLNERQCHVEGPCAPPFHPFTCPQRGMGNHSNAGGDQGLLIATESGWECPTCGFKQDYAYRAMVEAPLDKALEQAIYAQLPSAKYEEWQAILLARIDRCLTEFTELHRAGVMHSDDPPVARHATVRLWATTAIMLQCLRRRRLALLGVEQRPGYREAIDPAWQPYATHRPPTDQWVHVLMGAKGITNPGHPGYGTDRWVVADRLLAGQESLVCELVGAGSATHWRELAPAEQEALQEEAMAEIKPLLHVHGQAYFPNDDVNIVGNQSGLRALQEIIAKALRSAGTVVAGSDVFSGDGERYRVQVQCKRGIDVEAAETPCEDHTYEAVPGAAAPASREDMQAFARHLQANPTAARAFFSAAGILTPDGQLAPHYRAASTSEEAA